MSNKKRSSLRRRVGYMFTGIVVLLLIGWIYQGAAERSDLRRFPPQGELVSIGSHRLHMQCVGEGKPTVMLEAGLGNGVTHWAAVLPSIASFTRVCAYDRSGLGHSDAGPLPRGHAQVVSEYERLIEAANIEGPLVLVGHSNGALYQKLFAVRNPELAAALVMVDPSPENLPFCDELPAPTRLAYGGLVSLAPFGVPRLLLPALFPLGESMTPESRASFAATRARTSALEALWSEWRATCDLRTASAAAGIPPEHTLVTVLSASNPRFEENDFVNTYHQQMADSYPGAEFVVVRETGHWIQFDQPEVVVNEIKGVVDRILEPIAD